MEKQISLERPVLPCSFCGEEVRVVCGPAVYICEPCSRLCVEIFEQSDRPKSDEQYDGA